MHIIKPFTFYLAISLIFIAIFLSGSSSSWISTLLIIFSIFVLIIANHPNNKIPNTPENILVLLLIAFSLIALFFSLLPPNSLEIVVLLVWFFTLFIYCQKLVDRFELLVNLSKIFVFIVTIFGILSISKFIQVGLLASSKLDGIVGASYVYGNFLILPFLLSIYLVFHTKGKWQKVLWFISSAILLSSFILTFSAGSWISLTIAGLISALIYQKKIRGNLSEMSTKFVLKRLFVLVLLSFFVFCGIWYMAKQTILNMEISGIVDVVVSSNQNLNSLVITFIFIIFVAFLFWKMFKLIYQRKNFSWLLIVIFTALVGSVVNSLGDDELSTNQLFVFFIFAGSIYGYLLHTSEHKIKYMKYWVNYALVALVILSAITAIQFLRANLARERGDFQYLSLNNSEEALKSYFQSITYNSHEPLTWYNLWRVYYGSGQYDLAKNSIKKALELYPGNEKYEEILKMTEEKLGYPQ
jgi:hypothetical protein